MKYFICTLLLCIGIAQLSTAQETYSSSGAHHPYKHKKKTGFDPSRLIIGGTAVIQAGTDYTDLGISPTVGYKLTDQFSAGVGIGYQFVREQTVLVDPISGFPVTKPVQANYFTPNVWGRYIVYRNFFVESIFEYNIAKYSGYQQDNYGNISSFSTNVNVPCLLLGGGARMPLAGRTSIVAELLYDVLQQQYSPYLNTF